MWLSEAWHLTKARKKKMNSWSARILAQVVGVRIGVDEYVGDFGGVFIVRGTRN